MKRKAIITFILMISCMLVVGCTGTRPGPDKNPTSNPSVSAIATLPTAIVPDNGVSGIDDTLVSVSGEPDESLPEEYIPTPDAGQ